MEEGELSDDGNVSYETVSSVGSLYFGDDSNSVYCNKSKSLDGSSLNLSNKTVGPRPRSCDPNSFPNACVSKELHKCAKIGEELSNSSTQSMDRKRFSNKDSQKGNKENFINDSRSTHFTGRLSSMPSATEPELLENHPHTDRVTLKRKHSRPEKCNSNNIELTEVHPKRKKRRRKKQTKGHNNDSRDHYRNNSSNLQREVICNEKQKFRNKRGAKHKKNDGLLHRVISKSGPSQVKEISDPLISGCAESSLMKKLVGSGTLIIKSNSVSSDLKCEIGSTASISSPDMEMFEDLHVTSSDPDSLDDVLIISEDDITFVEQNMPESTCMNSSTVNKCPESMADYSDDSEIEVIIPEKKIPKLIVLHSDGEEEEVVSNNENQGNQTLNVNSDIINPLSLVTVSNQESVENNISEMQFDKEDITDPGSEKTNETNDEEDNNVSKLRMIALNSKLDDNNKVSSETESQSEDNIPCKSVETPLATRSEEDNDVLILRVMALKSAMLKKHNERVKKGMQVRKGSKKRNEITNDNGRRSSGSSAYSPSNITSPLSPSTSYELSLQGEEDMEIAESDVEGEIVEEVNNLCENVQLNVSGDVWKEPVNVMGHPVVINSWIDGNVSVPNEFYPGIPSSQKYSYPLSKHILEYSQPLPPGVDPVASSGHSLTTFCSSQFKLLPPPPLPSILSLPPPPPPPPLSPQPLDTINKYLPNFNTSRNVTDFVQSGNEFSVHHTVPVFMQNNANLQCSSLNTQFCNTALQTPENCLDISKSSECNRATVLPNCISSQCNYEGNVNASYFNNLDNNVDTLCHSQLHELFPKPDQLNNSFLANLKIGSRQDVKSRPNLLEIPINKNINTDFINTNTVPLKTPTSNIQAGLSSNNEIELSNKIEELIRPNDEVSFGNKNIPNVNRKKIENDKTLSSKKNVSAGRRKKKLRLMKKKAAQLSHVILKDYFRSPQLLENPNIQKEQNEGPSSENDINNFQNKDSNVNVDNIKLKDKYFKQNYEQFCETKKIQQISNIRNINNFDDNESSILNTPIKFYLTDYFSVLDAKEKVKYDEDECQTDTDKNKSTVEEEEFENLETSQSEAEILESVNPSCSNDEILNENANKCSNTGNNEDIDMDLAEMIVLDEVGMSPEHRSKEMDEEIVIENEMKLNEVGMSPKDRSKEMDEEIVIENEMKLNEVGMSPEHRSEEMDEEIVIGNEMKLNELGMSPKDSTKEMDEEIVIGNEMKLNELGMSPQDSTKEMDEEIVIGNEMKLNELGMSPKDSTIEMDDEIVIEDEMKLTEVGMSLKDRSKDMDEEIVIENEIKLNELGMSPEHSSKEMDKEIVIGNEMKLNEDDIVVENEMNVNDDEDDVDILRAKALTSISTKIFDFSKIPIYKNKNTLKNSTNQRMPRESFIDNGFSSNKAFAAYINPKNLAENFSPNRVTELGEKSRYHISHVTNNEHVRSVVKGKSEGNLKVVIPSDGPNISTVAQISPPLVSRLVINVGEDSDTDEDPHNECDEWSRKVIIRDSENKQLDQEGDNISVDVEKSVEMLLSDMRRQHENMLYYEPIEMLIEKPVPSVTEFNVTGVFPSPKTPVKRLSTTDQTPVHLLPHSKQEEYQRLKQELDHMERLLPHSKQEEYRKLKQELANMEKQRQLNTKKVSFNLNPTPKPSSSSLKYVSETCKQNKEAILKNNSTSEQKLPVEKSTEPSRMNLEKISLTQDSEEVEKIDKIGILRRSSTETSNNHEKLLPHSKQEEYRKLKQELANMEKQRQLITKKVSFNLNPTPKPSSSSLKYVSETCKQNKETILKNNSTSEQNLPVEKSTEPSHMNLEGISLTQDSEEVEKIDKIGILRKSSTETSNNHEKLLPHSKQEECQKLKQEFANMEKQCQLNTKKVLFNLIPTPKPSSSSLMNVSETCKQNKETILKNNSSSEQKLPVEKSTEQSRMNLEERSLTQDSEEVEKIDKIGILNTSSTETSNNHEVCRIKPTIQDLVRAEKELLSERYTVIDELTEMNNLMGDFERAQEKLTGRQNEVARLKKALIVAEEKLQKQKSVISMIQNDFFTTHAKMVSGKMTCDQWEKTCSKLGVELNETNYELPNGGKKLLVKKIQHVLERTKKLKIKVRRSSKKTSSNSIQSSDSIESRKTEKPKEQATVLNKEIVSNDAAESQISETSSQNTLEQMETCDEISTEDSQVSNEAESQNNKTILYENDLTSKTSEILFSTLDCTLLSDSSPNESIDNTISPDKTDPLVLSEGDLKSCKEAGFGINRVPETQSDVTCPDVNKTILKDASDGTQMNFSEEHVTVPSEMKVQDNKCLKGGNAPVRLLKSQSKISNYRSPLQHFGIIQKGKCSNASNPQAVLCPFDLMGKCLDHLCPFTHHTKSS